MVATSSDADIRNGPRAVELAERAFRLTGDASPVVLRTLAAAYAIVAAFLFALSRAPAQAMAALPAHEPIRGKLMAATPAE